MQRQAGAGRASVRAQRSSMPNSGSVDLCGREDDRLQLICKSLGGHDKLSLPPIKSGDEAAGLGIAQMRVLHFRALQHCHQDSFEG